MALFKNKYRIESARLQTWDYSSERLYFITICTKDRNQYFVEVVHYEMQLSPAGILADVFWHEIKNHAKNIELGEFVVMPNHIHGILILHGADAPSTAVPSEKTIGQTRFQNPRKNSISSIIWRL